MSARRSRRTNVIIVLVGIVLVGLAVLVARDVWLTDSSEPIAVEEAVDRFRSETTTRGTQASGELSPPTTDASPAELPEPGVYRYRTAGGESIDAMGGVTRDYPAETTITVTRRGCGVHLSWNPLQERRDEWELCAAGPAVELQTGGLQFHEFFGQGRTDEIRCEHPVALITPEPLPMPLVERVCTLADDPWNQRWEIVGRGDLEVGGLDVPVTHVRMTIEDDDEYWEYATTDWYLADSGLPVGVSVETTSRSPSIVGAVVYREIFELELVSMSPLT